LVIAAEEAGRDMTVISDQGPDGLTGMWVSSSAAVLAPDLD
jgi:hypothetical protein